MPNDARAREILAGQDYLSLLVEQSAEGASARVTGPMIDYLPAADAEAICARMAEPDIRIVSLTITEGWLLPRRGGQLRSVAPGDRGRCPEPRCARRPPSA